MPKDTSWQSSSRWYQKHLKGPKSSNHHELIVPKLLDEMSLKKGDSLLDLGCGQGILGMAVPKDIYYMGLDASRSLVLLAQKNDLSQNHHYKNCDVTKAYNLDKKFSHASFVLSLQNMSDLKKPLFETAKHLKNQAKLYLVLNHPCFRIPKHSSWETLDNFKGQYRRIDRYMTPFKSKLQTHPSKGERSPITWSFHHPLTDYFEALSQAGFLVENLIELCSGRKSYGKAAKQENFARKEFPLFMILKAILKK